MSKKLFLGIFAAALFCGINVNAAKTTTLEKGWKFQRTCDAEAVEVTVPHCWNAKDGADGAPTQEQAVKSHSGFWRGLAAYSRELDIKPKAGKRYFVRCEGASSVSSMWINGLKLGDHIGGFGAFCYEVTPFLKDKGNTLTILVDNAFNADIAPYSGDFTMNGGLYRPVTLFETNDICIDRANKFATPGVAYTQTALDNTQGTLEVVVNVAGSLPLSSIARFTITDAKGNLVTVEQVGIPAGSERTREVKTTLKVTNPTRWDGVKNPYLYTVKTELIVGGETQDEHIGKWGFRSIAIDPEKGFILNGRVMKVKGVNRHQDREGKGWAITPEDHEEDYKLMLEMGVDALRAAHYPHAEIAYEIADRVGLLVWAEIPLVNYCTPTQAFCNNSKFMLEEMIRQHQNHPSIVMWGLSNELGNGPKSTSDTETQLMKELPVLCEKLDPTRLCVIAASRFRAENYNLKHFGFNIYPGWYGYTVDSMPGIIENWCTKHPGQGISVSEYGAGGSIHCHEYPYPLKRIARVIHPWHSEEYQTYSHERHYRGIKYSGPQCWGSYLWNMFEFGADHRREGDRLGINDKGLITYDRKVKKDVFFFYQANWTDKPMVHITSRRFTKRPATIVKHPDYNNQPLSALDMPFKIFSNCDEIELFVNGKSLGVKKPDDMKTVVFPHTAEPGKRYKVKAVGTKDGKSVSDSYTFETLSE